jgi:membrane protein
MVTSVRPQTPPPLSRVIAASRRRYEGSAAEEFGRRLKGLNLFTTITMFGATFLMSTLPLLILVSALTSRRVEDGLSEHLGLNAQAAHAVRRLFQHSGQYSVVAMALALLIGFAGSIGLAQIVQTSYEQIFAQSHPRRGNLLRWLLWTAALGIWLGFDIVVNAETQGLWGGWVLDGLAALTASIGFFWWSMHLLLSGQRPWRGLLVPAVVTAVLWVVLEIFGALYFSASITKDTRLYGAIGGVFSLITWFIAIDVVVVVGALAGDVGQSRWQRARPAAEPAVEDPPPDDVLPDVPADPLPVAPARAEQS